MIEVKEIPIGKIQVGEHEQRMEKDDPGIEELAASIRSVGIIEPLIVAENKGGHLLVAGHRRLRAAKEAKLSVVPCIVRDGSYAERTEVTIAENLFRLDLSPIERGMALEDALVKRGIPIAKLAKMYHKSEDWIRAYLDIARWPDDVQQAVHCGVINVSAASNLAAITDDVQRDFLLRQAVEQGATAQTTALWLQDWNSQSSLREQAEVPSVPAGQVSAPVVPQAPCFCCARSFPVNRMSHIPVCGECVATMRQAGMSAG
jgi:ParB family chromosome partitioning protein